METHTTSLNLRNLRKTGNLTSTTGHDSVSSSVSVAKTPAVVLCSPSPVLEEPHGCGGGLGPKPGSVLSAGPPAQGEGDHGPGPHAGQGCL